MEAKVIEIRDVGTFIPVLAVRLVPADEAERYLLSTAGYGCTPEAQYEYVLVFRIAGGRLEGQFDPRQWGDRTMSVAHRAIYNNWMRLEPGAIVDVEYILGETDKPKLAERAIG